jgi:hypothetical protein
MLNSPRVQSSRYPLGEAGARTAMELAMSDALAWKGLAGPLELAPPAQPCASAGSRTHTCRRVPDSAAAGRLCSLTRSRRLDATKRVEIGQSSEISGNSLAQ